MIHSYTSYHIIISSNRAPHRQIQNTIIVIQHQNQEKRIEAKAKVGVQLRIASKEEELVKVLEEELVKEAESLFVSPTSRSSLRSKSPRSKILEFESQRWHWMVANPTFTLHTILALFLLLKVVKEEIG